MKRQLTLIIAAIVLFSSVLTSPAANASEDNELVELTEEQRKAADTSGDGTISIIDATTVQRIIAELPTNSGTGNSI